MKNLNVPIVIDGEQQIASEKVYTISELSYIDKMMKCKDCIKMEYQDKKRRRINYMEIVCAFDIETTNITAPLDPDDIINPSDMLETIIEVYEANRPKVKDFRPYAFMYHWQFAFDDQVVFGRTWEEFKALLSSLEKNLNLSLENRIVVWIHNASFEWQFIKDFIEYESGFFLEEKKPAKILTKSGIEFRCSYVLSNMSLKKFCENEKGVIHYKLSGDDYDYKKIRTPFTPMSENELAYCYNDVRGLVECMKSRLLDDTLATIPLTSTGYVRRDLRKAVRKNKKYRSYFLNARLDAHQYELCREAFRGGDTHANSGRADQINTDVWSWDIKSSYPAVIMECKGYPFTAFANMPVSYYMNNDMSGFALIMKVAFFRIRYDKHSKNYCGMPYIPLAKCNHFSAKRVIDNGRVIFAEFLELTVTNVDLEIILNEYIYDDFKIGEIWASRSAPLCQEIRDTTMEYFRIKTLLDGDPQKAYEYAKSKNKLNSIFGCMVMRIDQSVITWDPKKNAYVDNTPPVAEALAKFYNSRNNFLQYQQGLFITAFARKRLRDMLWSVGRDAIYCDTDSIKGVGDHQKDFEDKNKQLKQLAIDCGAYAENRNGDAVYLGVWECETLPKEEGGKGLYTEFKTLGAKKYVYKQDGKIKSTIAGVNKKAGAEYFTKHGVDGLKAGAIITESGHLTAFYNDEPVHKITIDHHTFTTASNVALVDNTYKIGVTEDYADILLKGLENILDIY